MQKRIFKTDKASVPGKTVSQAVIHGDTIYVCGQVACDFETDECVHGSVAEQTKLALSHMKIILEEAGTSMENVLMVNTYLSSMDIFEEYDEEYARFFPENPPARVTIAVKEIYDNLDVEISCIAAMK